MGHPHVIRDESITTAMAVMVPVIGGAGYSVPVATSGDRYRVIAQGQLLQPATALINWWEKPSVGSSTRPIWEPTVCKRWRHVYPLCFCGWVRHACGTGHGERQCRRSGLERRYVPHEELDRQGKQAARAAGGHGPEGVQTIDEDAAGSVGEVSPQGYQ